MDKVKNFCEHSMILWEMAGNLVTDGLPQPPPGSFRVNTSYLTDSYISFTLKLESGQNFCSNKSIRSSTYNKKKYFWNSSMGEPFCFNELWHIWLGGGKGYFRHSSKLFYIKGIAVGQPPISYHFWVCWWTSFFENLRPLRLEVAEICWGCWKQPQAHKKCFHNKNLVF